MGARILVADDDRKLAALVRTYLERAGHQVVEVHDGQAALAECRRREPDLAILDIMMPALDGHDVCHVLRAEGEVPVIFLTARTAEDDLVRGLGLGADDYVTKPFGMEELLARLRAAMRRAGAPVETVRAGDLVIDVDDRTVSRAGEAVHLTPTEWKLLEVLVRADGRLVRQAVLLHEVWGPEYERETHYLRVYLAQLRRKLEADASRPRHLLTDPGLGYRFVP